MATVSGIRGRFFATLLAKALEHYNRHEVTINAVLSNVAKAAIATLIAELPNIITALNPPGPQ